MRNWQHEIASREQVTELKLKRLEEQLEREEVEKSRIRKEREEAQIKV